jgi:glutaconate CoA-transferase subunit A
MTKLTTLDAALAVVTDGASVGMGGVLGRRRPLAAAAALAAAGRRRLHVYSFLAGAETELLVDAGCLATLTSGYLDPAAPRLPDLLAARGVRWNLVSEHVFVGGLRAAAAGLPFWPTLGAAGSDLVGELGLREVICPYTGRPVLAVPATPLDVAVVRADAATAGRAVLAPAEREFLDDADVGLARAARHVVVTVDRLASDGEAAGGRHTVLAPFEVDALVVAPP